MCSRASGIPAPIITRYPTTCSGDAAMCPWCICGSSAASAHPCTETKCGCTWPEHTNAACVADGWKEKYSKQRASGPLMKHSGPCHALPHRKPLQYQAVPSGCQFHALPGAGFAGNNSILQDPESTSTIRLRDSGSWIHRKSMKPSGQCFKQSHL